MTDPTTATNPTSPTTVTNPAPVTVHVHAHHGSIVSAVGSGTQHNHTHEPEHEPGDVARGYADARRRGLALSLEPPSGHRDEHRPVRGHTALIRHLEQVVLSPGPGSTHVLHGLGGCGKTSLALEIAHLADRAGLAVWWVTADTRANLETGLRTLATRLGAAESELTHRHAPDVLWERLHALDPETRWLLVLDDAEHPADLLDSPFGTHDGRSWLRPHPGDTGTVLVTSRSGGSPWAWWCTQHVIHPLATEDAVTTLYDHVGPWAGDTHDATALAESLGRLPLALTIAGSALARNADWPWPEPGTPTTFREYQQAVLRDGAPDAVDGIVARVWDVAVQGLRSRGHHRCEQLLAVLATMAQTPIPVALLLPTATAAQTRSLAGVTGNELRDLTRALGEQHLIELHNATPSVHQKPRELSIFMHPLVRSAALREQPAPVADAVLLVHNAVVNLLGIPDEIKLWSSWRLMAPHAHHLIFLLSAALDRGERLAPEVVARAAHAASLTARSLHVQGVYDVAGGQFEAINALTGPVLGERHPETLRCLHYIGVLEHERGQHAEALRRHDHVYRLRREVLGPDDAETLRSRHYRALAHHALGQVDQAEQEYRQVLEKRRRVLGPDHRHTFATEHNLVRVRHERGLLSEAAQEYEQLHRRMVTALGPDYRHTLVTQHNHAMVLHALGRLDEAEAGFRFVCQAETALMGAEHPTTLSGRYSLCRVLADRGLSEQAEQERLSVLAAQVRVLGEHHPETVITRERKPGPARSGPI
ncbi:tetratricopeptide repeat protein [Kineosporia sp. J2-2]|uniref:Tetratricopeptide repeat protein n=1 Tax=Kineosporia corallincola TaxID=2835133 RepID=A0ABS5TS70_9ACTN|nr:tetratricopeptide repeat protein [Kineosporia corallincola]MBT0773640.1 tetratricopeptide repeat protein [Kineosporia corallincola]